MSDDYTRHLYNQALLMPYGSWGNDMEVVIYTGMTIGVILLIVGGFIKPKTRRYISNGNIVEYENKSKRNKVGWIIIAIGFVLIVLCAVIGSNVLHLF